MKQTDLADEYTPREPRNEKERQHYARAKGLQTKTRLQALERLPNDPARLERFRSEPERMGGLLRWALAQQEHYPQAVPVTVRAVIAACGSLDCAELNIEELKAIITAYDQQTVQLQQAA